MALVHRVGWDPNFVRRNRWLWPLADAAALLASCADWPGWSELDAVYARCALARGARPLGFAPPAQTRRRDPAATALEPSYDARIALHSQVPTRPQHWHDLLNALCFAVFPHAKAALHARQWRAQQAQPRPLPNARSREQDALTLFDEGGVVLAAHASAAEHVRAALVRGTGDELLALERAGRARIVPFGHALFEHMVEGLPCPGACARVVELDALPNRACALLEAVDHALTGELHQPERFRSSSEMLHLRLEALAS